jgi:metal-dependent hydrolase (beta-lactamase superfamily II)
MKVRITTLSENTAGYGLIAEWGLSVLVEVGESGILVDTGMSFSATYNADLMGIDLREINCIVLSHGHADHTGGLREVFGTGVAVQQKTWNFAKSRVSHYIHECANNNEWKHRQTKNRPFCG